MQSMEEWITVSEEGMVSVVKVDAAVAGSRLTAFRDWMLDNLATSRTVRFEFDCADHIDAGMVQLLLAFGRELRRRGIPLEVSGITKSLEEQWAVAGLTESLAVVGAVASNEGISWGLF